MRVLQYIAYGIIAGVLLLLGFLVSSLWRHFFGLIKLVRILLTITLHGVMHGKGPFSYVDLFEQNVDLYPNNVQLIMAETGEVRTLKQVDDLANQVSHWACTQGCMQCDTIALMLLNQLDYPSIWLGLSKIGLSVALLNTNNGGKPFLYNVEAVLRNSQVKILIVDADLMHFLESDISELENNGIIVWSWGSASGPKSSTNGHVDISQVIRSLSTHRPNREMRNKVTESDSLLYIFTSGTTGLPKACKISQTRYFAGSILFPTLCSLTQKDVLYCALPLYHSAACITCLGGALYVGCPMVIRQKFSASCFSEDCVKYGVTCLQYIGEMCRYLVNSPTSSYDDQVKLRCAFGNGMRPEYWKQFQIRYHVEQIVEFYAATEGNVGLFNCFGKVGALGFVPRSLDIVYPLKLIRTDDEDQSKPLRNHNGFCIECSVNEVGLLVSEISSSNLNPSRRFDGYSDKTSTQEKILTHVFRENDRYFNTGDLLYRDAEGFFFWSDRVGDTFRWKGENVSTAEVSEVLSLCDNVQDVVVYGVTVPNTDGRAGMAAIAANGKIDLVKLADKLSKNLPVYARPLFLRIIKGEKLPVTSTHKHIKTDFVKESFDLDNCKGDSLYYLDVKNNIYYPLTKDILQQILANKIRF